MRTLGGSRLNLLVALVCIPFLLDAAASPRFVGRTEQPDGEIDRSHLVKIDEAVESSVRDGDLPGAVVLIWHRDQAVYHKAYGQQAVRPESEPMQTDTIFDLASLTKVVATTTAVMMLVEEGRMRLRDPVARYIPGFERHGKQSITVEHLLTHVSGLRPDFDLEEEFRRI